MLKVNVEKAQKINKLHTFSSVLIRNGGFYHEFLDDKNNNKEEVLICPTDALLLQENKIDDEKCVECLLCAHICPSKVVEFQEESTSLKKFLDYSKTDKKFVLRWISLVLFGTNNCTIGYELKVEAGRREKRIPLSVLIDNEPFVFKVVESYKDIERGILTLNDINDLISKSGLKLPTKIIIANESLNEYSKNDRVKKSIQTLLSEHDFKIISLEFLWKKAKNSILEDKIDWKTILFSTNLLI